MPNALSERLHDIAGSEMCVHIEIDLSSTQVKSPVTALLSAPCKHPRSCLAK
jgi:hypothetical protein